jgi:hypothetical protein
VGIFQHEADIPIDVQGETLIQTTTPKISFGKPITEESCSVLAAVFASVCGNY